MAPLPNEAIRSLIEKSIKDHKVFIFSKSSCPFCSRVKDVFRSLNAPFGILELDEHADGALIHAELEVKTKQRTVPNVFINEKHIGGCDAVVALLNNGSLTPLLVAKSEFEFDLVVIGGGSGGLAAAREAARLGRRVALCDFVKPSPMGTTWGLGGTCVNVGCIPKKLMHHAAMLGHSVSDAKAYGWSVDACSHDWVSLRDAVQAHIGSLNFGYRVALRDANIEYVNGFATFVDSHSVRTVNKRGKERLLTAESFVLAMGERPRYPDVPGAKELGITSDDLFSLPSPPGKTLLIGASYVSLECAGFLAGLGYDVTVMVRSILLRGFDTDMAERIGTYMAAHGVAFLRPAVPRRMERVASGRVRVEWERLDTGATETGEYDTVVVAVGRDPCTAGIGLEDIGVETNPKNGRVRVDERERTSVASVYAIGDIVEGGIELTPVAIQAGRLLARRLYGNSEVTMDYENVATTVFTPLEYGCVGLSEDDAIRRLGDAAVEVFHASYRPLEWSVPDRELNACYAKAVVRRADDRVVGLHFLGPNAGEVVQGFGAAVRLGLTKGQLDATVGIHPTVAETLTQLRASKSGGEPVEVSGC